MKWLNWKRNLNKYFLLCKNKCIHTLISLYILKKNTHLHLYSLSHLSLFNPPPPHHPKIIQKTLLPYSVLVDLFGLVLRFCKDLPTRLIASNFKYLEKLLTRSEVVCSKDQFNNRIRRVREYHSFRSDIPQDLLYPHSFPVSKEKNETNKQLPFKIKIQYPPVYFWRAEKAPPPAAAAVR